MALSGLHDIRLSKHRVEFLVDGVIAIVMTLLVLDLKVPDLPRHASSSELLHALAPVVPTFFALFLTFMLAGSYWFLHHMSMEYIGHANQRLVFINLGFMLSVSLFPFSAAMLGHFLVNPVAQCIYYGNQCMAATFLMVNWRYAAKAGLLTKVDPQTELRLTTHVRGLAFGCLAAAAASFFTTQSFIFLFLVLILNRKVSLRRAGRESTAAEPTVAAASTLN